MQRSRAESVDELGGGAQRQVHGRSIRQPPAAAPPFTESAVIAAATFDRRIVGSRRGLVHIRAPVPIRRCRMPARRCAATILIALIALITLVITAVLTRSFADTNL